ncbi:Ionotropic receptor 93a [Nymphon striatum]|nr:Ionotropic receptor 93a [Nymphon striatum]
MKLVKRSFMKRSICVYTITLKSNNTKSPPYVYKIIAKNGTISWSGLIFDILTELSSIHSVVIVLHLSSFLLVTWPAHVHLLCLIAFIMSFTFVLYKENISVLEKRQQMQKTEKCKKVVYLKRKEWRNVATQVTLQNPATFCSINRRTGKYFTTKTPNLLLAGYIIYRDCVKKIDSWLGIAAMVSLMGPILFGIHRFSYYYKINDQTSKSKGLCSFGNCSWYIFGAMVNQGGIHLPAADSGRLAVAFWWIFQIITVTTYSGNLVAFLTFPKQENPFDNIANLRSSNLKWASIKQSSLEFLGAQAKEGILKEIYTTSKFYEKNDESKVISNVRNQKEVFFYDRVKLLIEQANDYDRNGHCGLEPSTTILSENPIGLAVPAHSPSLKLLNTEIRKMLQGGLVDKWKRKYWPGENACTMKKTAEIDSNRTVTLSQIYGSYYVLAIGFGAGIIMLLAEYVSKKYRNKTNRVQSIDIRQELAIENMTRVHF